MHLCPRLLKGLSAASWLIFLNVYFAASNHSTETAVLKVITDVLRAADRDEVTLLCLLDLSAAFDTVDHDILLARLQISFGVHGTALSWLESFLRGRTQSVSVSGKSPDRVSLTCEVPGTHSLSHLLR